MKRLVALVLCAVGLSGAVSAEAEQFIAVTAWRGETVYAPVQDRFVQAVAKLHGVSRDGVSFAVGAFKPVPYQMDVESSFLTSRLDVFEWMKKSPRDLGDKVMCRVTVGADVKPGRHDFGAVVLTVVDRVLPPRAERRYFLDLWQHPWAVARYFDVKPFSRAHYKRMKPVYETLAEVGQRTLTVTLLDLPWNHQCYDGYRSMIGRVKKDDGTWEFDYSLFDEYVEFGRACGIGPDIACYTMCPWEFVCRWKNEKGEVCSVKALPGTPAFADYWGDFLVDFAKHLKAKGWFEHTSIAMDERKPEDVGKIAAFIREKAPGLKIAMAGAHKPSEFKETTINTYSQAIQHITPEFIEEAKQRRADGLKTTFYVCMFPNKPNTFMSSPDAESFLIGVAPALMGLDGFLRWAANSWPRNPYENAACYLWKPGDTFLVYPNGEPSARLIALRAGIIAAEKLWILEQQGLYAADLANLRKWYPLKALCTGEVNYRQFIKDVDRLVNRQDAVQRK